MHQISLKLVLKNICSLRTHLLFGAKKKIRRKLEENPTSFKESYLRNCWGYFFQIGHVR